MAFVPVTDWDVAPPTFYSYADTLTALATSIAAVEAATPAPPTPSTSPGYIGLGYGSNFLRHKTRVRLTVLADPNDVTAMATEALAWATGMAWAIGSLEVIDTFYVYGPDGALLYQTLLSAPQSGHIVTAQLQSNSFTWTLTGHGHGLVGGPRPGEARHRGFPYIWYEQPARGTKNYGLNSNPPLLQAAQPLAVSTLIWADFYGNKAGIRGSAPIQMNSATQNKEGW
jgi:hypothetical protein